MVKVTGSIEVGRSVEETFDYAADWRNEAQWNELAIGVEKASPGPIGVGTRFIGTYKQYGTLETTITEYSRPARHVIRTEGKVMTMVLTATFTPAPGGAVMHKTIEVRMKGAMKLLTPVMGRLLQRQLDTLNAGFKRAIEQPAGQLASRDAAGLA